MRSVPELGMVSTDVAIPCLECGRKVDYRLKQCPKCKTPIKACEYNGELSNITFEITSYLRDHSITLEEEEVLHSDGWHKEWTYSGTPMALYTMLRKFGNKSDLQLLILQNPEFFKAENRQDVTIWSSKKLATVMMEAR